MAPRDTVRLFAVAGAAAAVAAAVGVLTLALIDERAPAVAARHTARVSFGGFAIAYALAPLARRARSTLADRERMGWAAFVATHVVHLGFLANNVLRQSTHPPLWRASGGIAAYAIIGSVGLALLATRPGRATPRLRWLVDLGGLWISFVFVTTYAGRAFQAMPAPDGSKPAPWAGYAVLLAVAVAVPLAHWFAVWRSGRSDGAAPST